MAITFKDFAPVETMAAGGGFPGQTVPLYTGMSGIVVWVSTWVDSEKIDVINMETLVLPSLKRNGTVESDESRMKQSDRADWYQVIRVWYRT